MWGGEEESLAEESRVGEENGEEEFSESEFAQDCEQGEEQKKELMEMINKTNFRELFRSSNKEYFIQWKQKTESADI